MTSTDEKPANFATNWFRYLLAFLIALAVGTYLYGILGGSITVDRRLDTTSIVLIIVAAGLVFLIIDPSAIEGLTSITFGSFKAEFAQLRRQQEVQQRQVDSMSAVLALLLTDEEQAQLLRLRRGQTPQHRGSHELRTLLRKLRGMRLLQMKTDQAGKIMTISAMEDEKVVDLSEFLTLTDLGTRIAAELERIEADDRAAMVRGVRRG
jgi:hypothetical protein